MKLINNFTLGHWPVNSYPFESDLLVLLKFRKKVSIAKDNWDSFKTSPTGDRG